MSNPSRSNGYIVRRVRPLPSYYHLKNEQDIQYLRLEIKLHQVCKEYNVFYLEDNTKEEEKPYFENEPALSVVWQEKRPGPSDVKVDESNIILFTYVDKEKNKLKQKAMVGEYDSNQNFASSFKPALLEDEEVQVMYVMAALKTSDNPHLEQGNSKFVEVVLCKLVWKQKAKVLQMTPGFNFKKSEKVHQVLDTNTFTINSGSTFTYTIECYDYSNISLTAKREVLASIQENDARKDFERRRIAKIISRSLPSHSKQMSDIEILHIFVDFDSMLCQIPVNSAMLSCSYKISQYLPWYHKENNFSSPTTGFLYPVVNRSKLQTVSQLIYPSLILFLVTVNFSMIFLSPSFCFDHSEFIVLFTVIMVGLFLSCFEFSSDETKHYHSSIGYYSLGQSLNYTLVSEVEKSALSNNAARIHIKIISKDADRLGICFGHAYIDIAATNAVRQVDIPILRMSRLSLKEALFNYYLSSGTLFHGCLSIDDWHFMDERYNVNGTVSIGTICLRLSSKLTTYGME